MLHTILNQKNIIYKMLFCSVKKMFCIFNLQFYFTNAIAFLNKWSYESKSQVAMEISRFMIFLTYGYNYLSYSLSKFEFACYKSKHFHSNVLYSSCAILLCFVWVYTPMLYTDCSKSTLHIDKNVKNLCWVISAHFFVSAIHGRDLDRWEIIELR